MRNLLHKTKLEEFKAWLDAEGIAHRPGRGDYQALQVCKDGKHWNCVYERNEMHEHYSTDKHLDPLVRKYCKPAALRAVPLERRVGHLEAIERKGDKYGE